MVRISQFQALDFVRNEVNWLRLKWCAYRRLYVIGENDDGVLVESASEFFGVVQGALWRDATLTICRLFDQTRGTETLESALKSVSSLMLDANCKRLKGSLDPIDQKLKAANLRDARVLVLAHSNREVARGSARAPATQIQAFDDIVYSISDWVIDLHLAVKIPYSFDETELHSSMDGLVKRLRGA